jgi:hypothetical protein
VTGAFGTCGEETTSHERTQGSAGVSGLSDAERDACEVVQALAGLAALLTQAAGHQDDPATADARRTLVRLAESGGEAAVRVLEYLRTVRGAGDGEAVAVPPHLGQWREWTPPRGHLLGRTGVRSRIGEVHPRRCDPGE